MRLVRSHKFMQPLKSFSVFWSQNKFATTFYVVYRRLSGLELKREAGGQIPCASPPLNVVDRQIHRNLMSLSRLSLPTIGHASATYKLSHVVTKAPELAVEASAKRLSRRRHRLSFTHSPHLCEQCSELIAPSRRDFYLFRPPKWDQIDKSPAHG